MQTFLMNRKIFILLFISCFLVNAATYSQTNTSPYSMIGIGDIVNKNFDRSSGMGNAGISLSSYRYIYDENPASIAFLSNNLLAMEVSGNMNAISYKGNQLTQSNTSSQFQVQRFVMGTKVTPFWGMSFGLKQFSSSNYYFSQPQYINGGNGIGINTTHVGSGGINQVFISNAARIGKNFSLGVNASYLFGHMKDEEQWPASLETGGVQLNSIKNQYYTHFYFQGGLQYHAKLSPKWQFGLGAVGSMKTTLKGNTYYTLSQGDGNISIPLEIINDSVVGVSKFNLPIMYGGGLSLTYDNKLTFSADYKQQKWSSVTNISNGLDYSFTNSNQISGGIEYTKRKNIVLRNHIVPFDKYFFQIGGYYNNEYLSVRGYQLTDAALTLGVGINYLSTTGTGFSTLFNVQLGSRGTTKNNLIKENYIQLGVTISFISDWVKYKLQ